MQHSWKQLKSDNTSWQSTLMSSYNLQSQWHVLSTLYHEMKNQLTLKVGFEGTPKIGPVLEVAPSYLQGKYGVEIRVESVNIDNSHSWVRISHGLKKLQRGRRQRAGNLWNEDGSICVEDGRICICKQIKGWSKKFEEFALKTNVLAFVSRSKARARPRRRISACSSTRTVPICERSWTDVEPDTCSLIAHPVSKQLSTLLRHGHLLREEDGAIEFWRSKDYLRTEFEYTQCWSDEMWKSKMAGGGGNKKRFQYCTGPSGQEILDLRAIERHSGRNPIDLTPLAFSVVALSMLSAYTFHFETGISPWTTACCPCRYFAPAVETNFVHAAIDSMPFLPELDYLVLSPLVLRASRRAQFWACGLRQWSLVSVSGFQWKLVRYVFVPGGLCCRSWLVVARFGGALFRSKFSNLHWCSCLSSPQFRLMRHTNAMGLARGAILGCCQLGTIGPTADPDRPCYFKTASQRYRVGFFFFFKKKGFQKKCERIVLDNKML